jgi:hypothetical protein
MGHKLQVTITAFDQALSIKENGFTPNVNIKQPAVK